MSELSEAKDRARISANSEINEIMKTQDADPSYNYEPTRLQRLKVSILGQCLLGYGSLPDWRGYLPFFVTKCDDHGYYVAYPSGYERMLLCPNCLRIWVRLANEVKAETR